MLITLADTPPMEAAACPREEEEEEVENAAPNNRRSSCGHTPGPLLAKQKPDRRLSAASGVESHPVSPESSTDIANEASLAGFGSPEVGGQALCFGDEGEEAGARGGLELGSLQAELDRLRDELEMPAAADDAPAAAAAHVTLVLNITEAPGAEEGGQEAGEAPAPAEVAALRAALARAESIQEEQARQQGQLKARLAKVGGDFCTLLPMPIAAPAACLVLGLPF